MTILDRLGVLSKNEQDMPCLNKKIIQHVREMLESHVMP
jgi:hypothetical protein